MRSVLGIGAAAYFRSGSHSRVRDNVHALLRGIYPLIIRAAAHTNDKHIDVVVAEISTVALVAYLRHGKTLYRLPAVLNITRRTEQMGAALAYPLVYSVAAPVAR